MDDPTKDASAAPSPAQDQPTPDVSKAAPSTAAPGAPPKTLDEVAAAFIKADQSEDSPTEDVIPALDKADKKDGVKTPVADDDKEKEDVEGDETTDDEAEEGESDDEAEDKTQVDPSLTDATKPPPFHEHPRWKEVLAERDALKAPAESYKKLQDYCNQYDIPAQEVDTMFEIAALMRTDPAKAYERLTPIVEAMEQHLGIRLPPDLEADVASAKKTPAQAEEVAKLRADAAQAKSQLKQAQTRQQQNSLREMTSSVQQWIGNKQRTDLSFKPKVNGSPDGLYEFVDALYSQLVTSKPPTTPGEAVAYAEQAYNRASTAFGVRSTSKPVIKKSIPSTRSSTTPSTKPKTLDEVAMRFAGTTWATKQQR